MPLIRFHHAGFVAQRDAKILRAIKTLATINNLPAAEFWKGVDEKSRK